MPILFFISGFFTSSSYDRETPLGFIRKKLKALYIPWFFVSILQFQISRIVPYLFFFILGISAHKNGWLTDITFRIPEFLLASVVLLTPVLLYFTGDMMGSYSFACIFLYGFCRYALCVFMLIGFLFTVIKYFNKGTSFNRILNRSSFGLYIIHLDVVAFFLLLFARYEWFNNPVGGMILIMILSTTIGITLYFGYSKIKHLIKYCLLRC